MLSQRSAQFRSIQRRLLTRFKDKTPAPLQNLDTLLEGTYRQVKKGIFTKRCTVKLNINF
jgi:Bardet-Biedl syndrome 9 protein